MKEITAANFDQELPNIISDIKDCSFYAIDCEFTGLPTINRKFQAPCERYDDLRSGNVDLVIIQFGLCTFRYDIDKNRFMASAYSFYLMPLGVSEQDSSFRVDVDATRFLRKFDFNWNKAINEGVPYVSLHQKDVLMRKLSCPREKLKFLLHMESDERLWINSIKSQVVEWLNSAEEELSLQFGIEKLLLVYYFINDLSPDSHISIRQSTADAFILKKVSRKEALLKKETDNLILGLTSVIQEAINSKKPLVGHNVYLDLIMIYKQFISPLPSRYEEFKTEVHRLFPLIFDTKCITYNLRRVLADFNMNNESLEGLYSFLSKDINFVTAPCVPKSEPVPKGNFHNAGYDAYCAGDCFVKLAHLSCNLSPNASGYKNFFMRKTFVEQFTAMKPYVNKVNFINGVVDNISFNGQDPSRKRFKSIIVRARQPLTFSQVSEAIGTLSSFDVQFLSETEYIITIRNVRCFQEILHQLRTIPNVDAKDFTLLQKLLMYKSTIAVCGSVTVLAACLLRFVYR